MTASATDAASWRAPPTVPLAKIEAFLVENLEVYHFETTKADTWLILALTRYAMTHGAVTVGDLDKELAG
jgi:hypothetical protein